MTANLTSEMGEKQDKESNAILSFCEEAGKNNFFRFYITPVCQNRLFAVVIHWIIALDNAFIIMSNFLEDSPLKEALYENGLNFFLLIYLTEFMMKVYVHPRDYWRSPSNILSSIVILALCICACVGIGWQDASILHVLMILRLLNILPDPEVFQAMTAAYQRATKASVFLFGVILEIMLIYAVIGHDLFATTDPDTWGVLSEALLTLFPLAAMDDWTDIQNRFWELGLSSSWMFTTSYIILVHFFLITVIIMVYAVTSSRLGIKEKIDQKNTVTQAQLLSQEHEITIRELLQEQRGMDMQDIEKLIKKIEKSVKHKVTLVTKSWSTTVPYITEQLSELEKQNKIFTESKQLYSEVLHVLKEMLELENPTDGVGTFNFDLMKKY